MKSQDCLGYKVVNTLPARQQEFQGLLGGTRQSPTAVAEPSAWLRLHLELKRHKTGSLLLFWAWLGTIARLHVSPRCHHW